MTDASEGTDASAGITLLGSEMLTWSDLHGGDGGLGGLVVPHLLRGSAHARGRVLLAGPSTAAVAEAVASGFENCDVLTRSWLDARELRAELPEGAGVLCGPLDRAPRPEGGYDAIVVTGLDRLHSAEEDTPGWRTVLGQVAGLLGESGDLYLAVANPVGIDRLLALHPEGADDDAHWPQGRAGVEAPHDLDEVLHLLAHDNGLSHVETWVCHGPRHSPTLAATRSVLRELRHDGVVRRTLRAAYDTAPATPALVHPGRAVLDLVLAGLGVETAPTWVVHVRSGARPESVDPVPTMLVAEHTTETDDALVLRLEHGSEGWRRELVTPTSAYAVAARLHREPQLLEGRVPDGPLLSDELADHLAQHDVSGAGVLLRRLRDWLSLEPPTGGRLAALADRLVLTEESLELLDPSLVATGDADADAVLLRILLRFSADLLASGGRHPWSSAETPRLLAGSLVAAAGIELGDALYERAATLDRALSPETSRQPDFEAPLGGADVLTAMPYAELVELAQGLAERAALADAHVVWLLKSIQGRQRMVRRTRGELNALTGSREYRLGRRVFWLRAALRRRADRLAEKRRPRGEWREPVADPSLEDEPVIVEEHLVPPGYQPGDTVRVIATGTDVPPD